MKAFAAWPVYVVYVVGELVTWSLADLLAMHFLNDLAYNIWWMVMVMLGS